MSLGAEFLVEIGHGCAVHFGILRGMHIFMRIRQSSEGVLRRHFDDGWEAVSLDVHWRSWRSMRLVVHVQSSPNALPNCLPKACGEVTRPTV